MSVRLNPQILFDDPEQITRNPMQEYIAQEVNQ